MPDDLGLPLLAHRQIEWNLEAFYFELMSAYDTLLQELNIIYAYDLKLNPEDVRWNDKKSNRYMKKLLENILQKMTDEREKDWFKKVRWYRNTATHHYTVPLSSGKTWAGNPINYSDHRILMQYSDEEGKYQPEDIVICKEYLKYMVLFISSIWQRMAENCEE